MLWRLGTLLANGYQLLLVVAAGGFVGANFAGFLPFAYELAFNSQRAPDSEFIQAWMHGGWIVGAGLFALGAVQHRLRAKPRSAAVDPHRLRTTRRRATVEIFTQKQGLGSLDFLGSAADGPTGGNPAVVSGGLP